MKKYIAFFIILALITPVFAHASLASDCGAVVSGNTPKNTGTATQTTKTGSTGGLENPLNNVPSIACLFYKIVDFLMGLSYVVIAIFLLLAGFKFVTAQGSTDKLAEAKKTFWYTVIGALILIGAYTIIEIVQGIIKGIQS